jgi:hypothetical protein
VPEWAESFTDVRRQIKWDETQYICNMGVGNKLIWAIVDTGAHRTVIDTKMCSLLGLKVKTEGVDCGRFSVPGSGAVHKYAGIVPGETKL